ncbi:MAG: hypothetical protein A2Y62_16225 [Candidatus Fischerbacteria bacterium RBG_13_37_8]|uniref:non-specific serine/threonine protein kinase n=1 Tax=Candidatus Fischerbacteria bacterium RBG_13_37_8 TaxID=1817863 RepID=A0A1F5VVU2_9BACT|nr:MAG: hypothetical protein A2Y62_16225 [Candidatus Fischerbacteria bacterium RBG_13_37_8]
MNDKILETISRYEIKGVLGKGSMGVVYKAYDPVLEREVAIKTIEPYFESDKKELDRFIERFKREAVAAGKLSHPNIITIYDYGSVDDKTPYIVMELIRGKTLKQYFEENIRFDFAAITKIIVQIARALDYAHKEGIVHRDIKPANIMLLDDYTVKIADFGIARMPHSELTRTGEILGTPNYMSPEQIIGVPADSRVDLFSLGVILYQLFTGEKPFIGETFSSLAYRIVHENPLAPKVLNPSISEDINAITMGLLEKDKNNRPSLEEVIHTMEGIQAGVSDAISSKPSTAFINSHQSQTEEVVFDELSLWDKSLSYIQNNVKVFLIAFISIVGILIGAMIFFGDVSDKPASVSGSEASGRIDSTTEKNNSEKQSGENKEVVLPSEPERYESNDRASAEEVKTPSESIAPMNEGTVLFMIPNIKHMHTIGSCRGTLIFYENGVEYQTAGKDQRKWRYNSLRGYELQGTFLTIKTHEKMDYDVIKLANRDFKFKLPSSRLRGEIASLLAEKITK